MYLFKDFILSINYGPTNGCGSHLCDVSSALPPSLSLSTHCSVSIYAWRLHLYPSLHFHLLSSQEYKGGLHSPFAKHCLAAAAASAWLRRMYGRGGLGVCLPNCGCQVIFHCFFCSLCVRVCATVCVCVIARALVLFVCVCIWFSFTYEAP